MTETVTYTYRLPKALKDAIRADADKHSRSANQHVVDILSAYLKGDLIPAEKLLTDPHVRVLMAAAVRSALPKAKAVKARS